jgi:hypothetical protein
VLDWPSDDRTGQIQRVKETTLGVSGKLANGDMQLLPMIEIEIPYQPGTFAGLPRNSNGMSLSDMPVLPVFVTDTVQYQAQVNNWFSSWLDDSAIKSNQISVRLQNSTTRNLIVYMPAELMYDSASKSPVGFKARAIFKPSSAAAIAMSVRLAWNLSMQADQCTTEPAGTNRDTWCADTTDWQTTNRIIHTYYDDFYATALTTRESRGLDVALIAQADTNAFHQYTWQLARNLDHTFVAGSATLNLTEITRRFDPVQNSTTTTTQRWGMPANAFKVQRFAFADVSDSARLNIPYTLNGTAYDAGITSFLKTTYPSAAVNDTINLLMVSEQRTRTYSGSVQADANGFFTVNMASAKQYTRAEVKWAPFIARGAGVWDIQAVAPYAEGLPSQYKPLIATAGGNAAASEASIAGSARLNQALYLAYYKGRSNIVAEDATNLHDQALIPGDATLAAQDAVRATADALTQAASLADGVDTILNALDTTTIVASLADTLIAVSNSIKIIQKVKELTAAAGALENTQLLASIESVELSTKKSALVLAIAIEVLVFGAKLMAIYSDDSLTSGQKASLTVSAIVDAAVNVAIATVMGIIAAIVPVGTIIVVVIAVLDLLISAVCNISEWAGAEWVDSSWAEYLCDGLVGNLSNILSKAIWADIPFDDMEEAGRLNPTAWDIRPVFPGTQNTSYFVQGQNLFMASTVVTRISSNWEAEVRSAGGTFMQISATRNCSNIRPFATNLPQPKNPAVIGLMRAVTSQSIR